MLLGTPDVSKSITNFCQQLARRDPIRVGDRKLFESPRSFYQVVLLEWLKRLLKLGFEFTA